VEEKAKATIIGGLHAGRMVKVKKKSYEPLKTVP
jgi:hypothetical protein